MTDTVSALYGLQEPQAQPAPVDPLVALEAEKNAADAAPKLSWGETYNLSVGLDHTYTNLKAMESISGFDPDPEWDPPADIVSQMEEAGIPVDWIDDLMESQSQAEYEARLNLYARRADETRLIASQGGKGIAARIVASMTDPVGVAVDAAATVVGGAGAVNRFRKIGGAVAAAGASNAAIGSLQGMVDPEYGTQELLTDFAAGAAFGTLFEGGGAFLDPKARAEMAQGLRKFHDNVKSGNLPPPSQPADEFDEVVTREAIEEEVDDPAFFARREELMALADGAPNDDVLRTTELELKRLSQTAEQLKARLADSPEQRTALLDEFLKEDVAVHGKAGAKRRSVAKLRERAVEARLAELRKAAEAELADVASKLERMTGEADRMRKASEALTELRRFERIEKRGEIPKIKRVVGERVVVTKVPRAGTAAVVPQGNNASLSAASTGAPVATGLDIADRDTIGGDTRKMLVQMATDEADRATRTMHVPGPAQTVATTARLSDEPQARALSRLLNLDTVQALKRDASGDLVPTTNDVAASDLAALNRRHTWGEFRRAYEQGMREMFAGVVGGAKRLFSPTARLEINNRVGRYMKGFVDDDPRIARMAQAARKALDDAFDLMKKHGVKGMENVQKAANYLPRLPKRHLWESLTSKMRNQMDVRGTVAELVRKGISKYRADNNLPEVPELTQKVAEAYADRLLTKTRSPDVNEVSRLDLDYLEDILGASNLTPAEADDILFRFQLKDSNSGPDAKMSQRHKERLGMDETVSIQLDDGSTMYLADLFENDVEVLLDRYTFESSGLAALAEKGIKNHKEVPAIIDDLHAQHRITDKERKALMLPYKSILGQPLEDDPGGTYARAVRTLGGFNFATTMGQVFWSMLAENGAIMGMASIRSLVKQLPAFGSIMRQVYNGTLDDDLARELVVLGNPGTSMLRNPVSIRAEDFGVEGLNSTKALRTLDRASQAAQRAVSIVSGLGPLNDMQQILFSRSFAQRMFDFAHGRQTMSDAFRERLMDYGMTKEDISRLMEHLKTHAVGDGATLKKVNLEKMEPDLERKLQVMFHRATTQVIQEADIGSTMPWMHSATAKLVTQFRSFSIVALHRRTLHGLARRDATFGLSFMFSALWASAGLAGRIHANYPEDHPYRKAVLDDPKQFAKSVFAATGESSILPMMIDTTVQTLGGDAVFGNFNRSTGNASSAIAGIPTIATLDRIQRTLGIPGKIVRSDKEVTEADVRSALALLPLNNILGIQRFNRWVASSFPSEYEALKKERQGY